MNMRSIFRRTAAAFGLLGVIFVIYMAWARPAQLHWGAEANVVSPIGQNSSQTTASSGVIDNPMRVLEIQRHYLNIPVKNGAPKRWVSLLVDGKVEREAEIELADGRPDWWAFMDLTPFTGRAAAIEVDRLPQGSEALRSIEQADRIKGSGNLYREKWRPQFHFTSRRGWNNDPNGLVFYAGEYHLFYQHNPFGCSWGNMHWGHAVSRDLVHWKELGDAIHPDKLGTIFSGSAVVDRTNTTGFAHGKEHAIFCIYTAAGGTNRLSKGAKYTQCLAYSTDRGRSWNKYKNNPVLPHIVGDNRDPKVIWYEPEHKWIMALYLEKYSYALFSSPDLKHWERMSDVTIPGTSECPEFFEIPLDRNKGDTRWVFYGGNGRYLIGTFDGRTFVTESGPHSLDRGDCFYASQTYNQIPSEDGRRIMMPWERVNLPGVPFNQMIGLPVELTLRTTGEGLRLFAHPVRELDALRIRTHTVKDLTLLPGNNPLAGLNGELFDIFSEFEPGEAAEVVFNLRGKQVSYDAKLQELSCGDTKAALKPVGGRIRLRMLVDRASIDIFGNDGRLYMPMKALLDQKARSLQLSVKGGSAKIDLLEVHELKSAWN